MRRTPVPALLLVLALAGCSDDSPTVEPSPSFSLPPLETPSETPSPTPSATTSPTASATASASRRVPALDGDVDGDGKKDFVRTTAEVLTVDLSSGGTVTAPIHAESPRSAPVLGYADVDRDGRSEVFVETNQGASTQFVTPYRYDGKVLHELQLEEGPARLGIGGSVTHGDGFTCPNGQLRVLSSDSQDGVTYTVHITTYTLGRTELVQVSSTTKRAKQGDPLVESSYRPDCGSVGD
ncbi:MAG: hypothetical protein M3P04_10410 [Actinomycetota bacterium]|nr:hypothetical protein [Actinomycetota bacterium]